MSAIANAAILYRKAQMGAVAALSDVTEAALEETNFYDLGYIEAMSKRIQEKLHSKSVELSTNIDMDKQDPYYIEKRKELQIDCRKLAFRLMFMASNDPRQLSTCEKIAEDQGFDFIQCIRGMQAYYDGSMEQAFNMIEPYYVKYGTVEEHFLVNKVFGMLLMKRGNYEKAASFLTYSLQFNPDDRECLEALKKSLSFTGRMEHSGYIDSVLEVLDWNWE